MIALSPPLAVVLFLKHDGETTTLGENLARVIQPPCTLTLSGPLGSGKTTFCQGFIHGKGYAERVKSPTYTLCEVYPLAKNTMIYHFDLYRLQDFSDWEVLGFDDILPSNSRENTNAQSIILIEWPERLGQNIMTDLHIAFEMLPQCRIVALTPHTPKGAACLLALFA
jgi:tRNA threonylcarbamoyladenosine biosynthesis protein TsaE